MLCVCRDTDEEEAPESVSLQDAEAAVNKAQQALHLSLPVGDPDAGKPTCVTPCKHQVPGGAIATAFAAQSSSKVYESATLPKKNTSAACCGKTV